MLLYYTRTSSSAIYNIKKLHQQQHSTTYIIHDMYAHILHHPLATSAHATLTFTLPPYIILNERYIAIATYSIDPPVPARRVVLPARRTIIQLSE